MVSGESSGECPGESGSGRAHCEKNHRWLRNDPNSLMKRAEILREGTQGHVSHRMCDTDIRTVGRGVGRAGGIAHLE